MTRIQPLRLVSALSSRVQATLRETPEATKVYLSDSKFALSWLALWFFHVVCAGLYGVWAFVHFRMTRSDDVKPLYFIGLLRDPDAFTKAGPVFAFFTATHTLAVTVMVVFSVSCVIPPARFLRWLQQKFVDEPRKSWRSYFFPFVRTGSRCRSRTRGSFMRTSHCSSSTAGPRHWMLRQATMEQRLICHAFDMLSDLTSTLVLPAAMAWPLLPAFDPHFQYHRGSLESQELSKIQLFAFQGVTQSWFDVFITTLFSLFLLGRVSGIKSSLHRQVTVSNTVSVSPANPTAKTKHITLNARKRSLRAEKITHLIHVLTLGWGTVVAGAHIFRETRPVLPWCVGQTSPWFTTKHESPMIKIDCAALAIDGKADEFSRLFDRIHLTSVSKLQISGCRSLEMPSTITKLSQLKEFHVEDSIIERWGEDAAILHSSLPELTTISIRNTPLTPFPVGLCCSGKLPQSLTELVFETANLSSLPAELEAPWTLPWKRLRLDDNAFTEIPDMVVRLRCDMLSMAGNKITVIPNTMFREIRSGGQITLASNPITTLPKSLAEMPRGPVQDSTNTPIEWLPSWVVFVPRLTLTGSRFCDRYGLLPTDQRAAALTADGMADIVYYWSIQKLSCK